MAGRGGDVADGNSSRRPTRERKKVEVFNAEVKEVKEFEVEAGKGARVGDIEQIEERMAKMTSNDHNLVALHRLLFKRPGKKHTARGRHPPPAVGPVVRLSAITNDAVGPRNTEEAGGRFVK